MEKQDANALAEPKTEVNVAEEHKQNDQSSDIERQDAASPQRPYTAFTKGQKRFISLVASFAAMFSTLMSYIYC